jgi:hypothetical protein
VILKPGLNEVELRLMRSETSWWARRLRGWSVASAMGKGLGFEVEPGLATTRSISGLQEVLESKL